MSGRAPPKRGAATSCQASFPWIFFFAIHRGCTSVRSSVPCPFCLCGRRFLFVADPFPKHPFEPEVCQAHILCQARLAQSVEHTDLNLKIEGSNLPRVMSLSFLLAFACTEKSVLVLEGKCIASLQEDPAEEPLCLARFYCATTMQGLELDLRFCDGKLDCFFC